MKTCFIGILNFKKPSIGFGNDADLLYFLIKEDRRDLYFDLLMCLSERIAVRNQKLITIQPHKAYD